MTGDFNIRDSLWDHFFPFYSSSSDDLIIIADSFDLALSSPTNPGPTRFSDTAGESNSVIDFMFLCNRSSELNHHTILLESRLSSDHAPLVINIPITEEIIQMSKLTLAPKSEQETAFVQDVISNFKNLNMSNIADTEEIEQVVSWLGSIIDMAWTKNAKRSRISRHSKQWWSEECKRSLDNYRSTRSLENWKKFKNSVKDTKQSFFDDKIQEVANKSQGPWELTNWIKSRKLLAIEAIYYNNWPCTTLDNLWNALHSSFNTALNQHVDLNILNEIEYKPPQHWNLFSKAEFKSAISKCNDFSALGPDKLSWRHLKVIIANDDCFTNIINITDSCINLGYWPNYFKVSFMIIIPKPNKASYNQLKAFWLIVLLNTLEKLIEKVIAERLQFTVACNDFIHPSQLGGLKFKSTTDAGVALTHIVWSGWSKKKSSSTLAFDISQFFLSLNHNLLTHILDKADFDPKVTSFFANYLVSRRTKYIWNKFFSPYFDVNVGVGQGSALSPILSSLYLSPFLYILENRLKSLRILVSILSFVDDGLIIAQNKSLDISNSHLFCSYNVFTKLLDSFRLVIEHSKTEIFHFSWSQGVFNPPPLNLSPIGGPILQSKDLWRYLGFIFDRKLLFHKHINFYANKAISTVKYMKLLENSSRGINPIQKRLLYRCCILPIALYGFQLWYYNKAPLLYYTKTLNKMQRRAAIWILGAFKTSPSAGIEAITGIIPIKFHLQKIAKRSQIWPCKLPSNHIIRSLMDDSPPSPTTSNPHKIGSLTNRQRTQTKGHLTDSYNKFLGIFPSFSPTSIKFSPGNHIIDNFSDWVSFNLVNRKEKTKFNNHALELNKIVLQTSSSPHSTLVITDASIRNDIATSVSHIHSMNCPLIKTVHHALFVTSTEAELFTIRCGINQACSKENVTKIIVITDSIHATKKIFNSNSHPYQLHSIAILCELQEFFSSNPDNTIEFWECPSCLKWRFHCDIDKDSKSFYPTPSYPCKTSWDYCKKIDSDDIIKQWKMTF